MPCADMPKSNMFSIRRESLQHHSCEACGYYAARLHAERARVHTRRQQRDTPHNAGPTTNAALPTMRDPPQRGHPPQCGTHYYAAPPQVLNPYHLSVKSQDWAQGDSKVGIRLYRMHDNHAKVFCFLDLLASRRISCQGLGIWRDRAPAIRPLRRNLRTERATRHSVWPSLLSVHVCARAAVWRGRW